MIDIPDDHPLVTELADARERIKALEQQVAEQQAVQQTQNLTPEQRVEAERQAHGQVVADAISKAQGRNS